MRRLIDLADLEWTARGYTPCGWLWGYSMETGAAIRPEIGPVPAKVPGSVQAALLQAGLLPDWNMGMDARLCEWVENRDWIFSTEIPADIAPPGAKALLNFDGLDGNGRILLDGKELAAFDNAFIPRQVDVTSALRPGRPTRLELVFEPPPRWLGQFGHTSTLTKWKPRFNYGWDWTSRMVQIGVWDALHLEVSSGPRFAALDCATSYDAAGRLDISGQLTDAAGHLVHIVLKDGAGATVAERSASAAEFAGGRVAMEHLPVSRWWPNGMGAQPLYTVSVELRDTAGTLHDSDSRVVGFRSIAWLLCEAAPAGAEPWLCAVNGRPVFLQGVNWTPILPTFADVTASAVLHRLDLYKQMGCNVLRVWGGAVLEKESFYRACDERGLLVWQEFPLSSSGIDNWPPEEERAMEELARVAESYIIRRRHHPSLLLWCGGNELQGSLNGEKTGCGKPVDLSHPLMRRFAELVGRLDPNRRFLPSSSSGPRFMAAEQDFGKGLHWDVHGPWNVVDNRMEAQRRYWKGDDALFRSESGCPGASPAALIRKYSGGLDPLPATLENPLWRRTSWWFDWPEFAKTQGREPQSLEEYCEWSQRRQADALAIAASSAKARFPRCGGFIVWMGHDSFPCSANTSIIDFEGNLKPAGIALRAAFTSDTAPR